MIGIVIATHGEFGKDLLETLKMILGDMEKITALSLSPQDSMETFQARMEKALQTVDTQGTGALVLVDMLGGTPFNVAVQLAQKRKIQVITGVNLPMLIKIFSHREETDLENLARETQKASRESIVTTLDLFKK